MSYLCSALYIICVIHCIYVIHEDSEFHSNYCVRILRAVDVEGNNHILSSNIKTLNVCEEKKKKGHKEYKCLLLESMQSFF